MRLSRRLLIVTALSLLPVVAVGACLVLALVRDRQAQSAARALAAARLVDNDLADTIGAARTLATAVAAMPELTGPKCAATLSSLGRELPAYSLLAVVNRDQRFVCAATAGADGVETTAAQLPWLQDVLTAGGFHRGRFASMGAVPQPFLPFGLALSQPAEALVLGLDLKWLARHLGEVAAASHQESMVLVADQYGVVLARWPDPEHWIGARLPPQELEQVRAATPGLASVPLANGEPHLSGFIPPAASLAGLFVLAEPADEGPLGLLDRSLVDAGLVAIASALGWGIAFALGRRWVLGPAEALFSLRLAERDAERTQQADALERRVAERTRALSECNNRLQVEIAERQRTEVVLRRSQKIQVMGQLVGGIAHDFNNMLATILGSLELMERLLPDDSDRLRRQIERAIAAVQRGSQLTRRVLAFARREPPAIRATDINALLADLVGLAAVALGRRIRVETELAPDLWPAMVEPSGLEAAILNLTLNARDAMPDGGAVTIATANATLAEDADSELEAGDYVRITVTDTGGGMSPEAQARAFEPFFSTKGTGSSGLGLAQVNGTVRQAGGAVRIRSEPGHGTQVTLLLPRSAANAEPVAGPLQGERPTPQMAPLVLLVDDDTAVRNVTSDMLKDLGCSVLEAEGGREALDLIERRRDDVTLAVVDYAMPEMNGVQLARAIRDRGIGAPIVLATGYAELAEPLDSRSSPLSIVLRKPFTINQLQTTITRLYRAPA